MSNRLNQENLLFLAQLHIDKLVDLSDQLLCLDLLKVHLEFAVLELGVVEGVIYEREQEG